MDESLSCKAFLHTSKIDRTSLPFTEYTLETKSFNENSLKISFSKLNFFSNSFSLCCKIDKSYSLLYD